MTESEDIHPIIRDAAQALDAAYQAREYLPAIAEELRSLAEQVSASAEQHAAWQAAVSDRHARMLAQLEALTARVGELEDNVVANTRAREDAEWEIQQLHSVMKEWHRELLLLGATRLPPPQLTRREQILIPRHRKAS